MSKESPPDDDESQVIALKVLTFLVSEPQRLQRFMGITGAGPETLRAGAASRRFLAGVLEYLCGDEPLLLVFAESEGIDPALIDAASRCLTEPPS